VLHITEMERSIVMESSVLSFFIIVILAVFGGFFVLKYELVSDILMLKIRGYYYNKVHDCVVEWEPPKKVSPQEMYQIGLCRPLSDCNHCKNVTKIDVVEVENLSGDTFKKAYAYQGKPLLIKNAAKKWKAMEVFSFEFFKYLQNSQDTKENEKQVNYEECQFFPYNNEGKHNFQNLQAVFDMPQNQWKMQGDYKPWYIGWNVCDRTKNDILQQFYETPFFIPEGSINLASTIEEMEWKGLWIFMGTPGVAAPSHIDSLVNPSWQAQIRGKKRWILKPPPECYWTCNYGREISSTAEPGDILFVNTNLWYHSTYVLEGLSISLGDEFSMPNAKPTKRARMIGRKIKIT